MQSPPPPPGRPGDHPEDRRRRNDALARIGTRAAIAAVPCLVIALITHALGVPWIVIGVVLAFIVYLVLFET